MLTTVQPDVVVTITRGYDDPQYSRQLFVDGSPDQTDPGDVLTTATPAGVAQLLDQADRLIVIQPWPALSFDPRGCLAGATYADECRGTTSGQLASEEAIEAVAADDPRVAIVDLDDAVCPNLPVCDPVVDSVITRRDYDHVTIAFAEALEPVLEERLAVAGAFAP